MALIGYARISTLEQMVTSQRDALAAAGCERIFEDLGVSGSVERRPGLDAALAFLQTGDVLVVVRLDRLGRSTRHTLAFLHNLSGRGVEFRSLREAINTSGPMGRAMLTILAAFAELERDMIRERTTAGLAAARARGRVGGRPRALTAAKVELAALLRNRGLSVAQIAEQVGTSRATIYRALASESAGNS